MLPAGTRGAGIERVSQRNTSAPPTVARRRPSQEPAAHGVSRSRRSVLSVLVDKADLSVQTDNMDVEDLHVSLSSDDPAVGLRASLALHRLAERVEANQVAAARGKGWSWQQIGDALGVTRQSVHTKYNKESS